MENIKFLIKEGINDNIHLMLGNNIKWDEMGEGFAYTVYLPTYEMKYMVSGKRKIIPLTESLAKIFDELQNYATIITLMDDDAFKNLFDFTAIKGNNEIGIFRILNRYRITKSDIEQKSEENYTDIDKYCKQLFDEFTRFNTLTVLNVEKVDNMPCPIGIIIKKPVDNNKIEAITAVLPELDFDTFVEQFSKLVEEV